MSKECFTFFDAVRTHFAMTDGDYVQPKTVYEVKQRKGWD